MEQVQPLQSFTHEDPQRRRQDLLPTEVGRKGRNTSISWGADTREAMAENVQAPHAFSRPDGSSVLGAT